jgi:hypothetical protein
MQPAGGCYSLGCLCALGAWVLFAWVLGCLGAWVLGCLGAWVLVRSVPFVGEGMAEGWWGETCRMTAGLECELC